MGVSRCEDGSAVIVDRGIGIACEDQEFLIDTDGNRRGIDIEVAEGGRLGVGIDGAVIVDCGTGRTEDRNRQFGVRADHTGDRRRQSQIREIERDRALEDARGIGLRGSVNSIGKRMGGSRDVVMVCRGEIRVGRGQGILVDTMRVGAGNGLFRARIRRGPRKDRAAVGHLVVDGAEAGRQLHDTRGTRMSDAIATIGGGGCVRIDQIGVGERVVGLAHKIDRDLLDCARVRLGIGKGTHGIGMSIGGDATIIGDIGYGTAEAREDDLAGADHIGLGKRINSIGLGRTIGLDGCAEFVADCCIGVAAHGRCNLHSTRGHAVGVGVVSTAAARLGVGMYVNVVCVGERGGGIRVQRAGNLRDTQRDAERRAVCVGRMRGRLRDDVDLAVIGGEGRGREFTERNLRHAAARRPGILGANTRGIGRGADIDGVAVDQSGIGVAAGDELARTEGQGNGIVVGGTVVIAVHRMGAGGDIHRAGIVDVGIIVGTRRRGGHLADAAGNCHRRIIGGRHGVDRNGSVVLDVGVDVVQRDDAVGIGLAVLAAVDLGRRIDGTVVDDRAADLGAVIDQHRRETGADVASGVRIHQSDVGVDSLARIDVDVAGHLGARIEVEAMIVLDTRAAADRGVDVHIA